MSRAKTVFLVLLGLAGAGVARADETDSALALQKVHRKIISEASPAVACILVTRSEVYQRDRQALDKEHSGRLGGFDPKLIRAIKGETDGELKQRQTKLDLADPGYVPQSFGSGVAIAASGLILTNYHVVQDATKVYVRLPGGKGSYADIHAADPRSDLAVLKLLNPAVLPLKTIALGDGDKVERGDFILTLSNPFAAGFRDGQPSASWGILSNVRRRSQKRLREEDGVKPLHYYGTLLQTDARLHLGCSGGALLNLQGEMVGLLTSLAAIQGGETPGGFAIPINASMRRIIDVLKRGEEVEYGFLGVSMGEAGANGEPGVRLVVVSEGSPAAQEAKLKDGDMLLAINGQVVHDADDVFTMIGTQLAGSKVKLLVRSGFKERTAEATLAKLYVPGKKIVSSLGNRPWLRGLRVDYTSLLIQQPPRVFSNIPPGIFISDVQPNSAAERAQFKTGDIITHVNRHPVNTPAAFYQAAGNAAGPIELTLYNFQQDPSVRVLR